MISGYGSDLQKMETLFLALDGAVILVSTAILTFVHPATFFPYMTRQAPKQVEAKNAFLDPTSYQPVTYEMGPLRWVLLQSGSSGVFMSNRTKTA
jgi:RTA1 like protein